MWHTVLTCGCVFTDPSQWDVRGVLLGAGWRSPLCKTWAAQQTGSYLFFTKSRWVLPRKRQIVHLYSTLLSRTLYNDCALHSPVYTMQGTHLLMGDPRIELGTFRVPSGRSASWVTPTCTVYGTSYRLLSFWFTQCWCCRIDAMSFTVTNIHRVTLLKTGTCCLTEITGFLLQNVFHLSKYNGINLCHSTPGFSHFTFSTLNPIYLYSRCSTVF